MKTVFSQKRFLFVLTVVLGFVLSLNVKSYSQDDDSGLGDSIVFDVNKDAKFVAGAVPTQMTAGMQYKIGITMRNAGVYTWNDPNIDQVPGASSTYELRAIPSNRTDPMWGINSVPLTEVVAKDQEVTFSFMVTAPANPGSYEFKWQMASGEKTFGESTPSVIVNVVKNNNEITGYSVDNSAAFVSQDITNSMMAGGNYKARIVMRNTGKTTWQPGFFWLEYQDPKQNAGVNQIWGTNKVALKNEVNPGEDAVFEFDVTAPETAGSYLFNWQMGTSSGTFGPSTTNVNVNVAGKSADGK